MGSVRPHGHLVAISAEPDRTGANAQASAPSGPIVNRSLHTCIDPSVSPNPYDTLAGARCARSAAQTFTFEPVVAGQPAHTYQIIDSSSGQCVVPFRFAIQSGACASYSPWTLQLVGKARTTYQIVRTDTIGSASPRCWGVSPKAQGQPGPLFGLSSCNGQPSQTFALPAGL